LFTVSPTQRHKHESAPGAGAPQDEQLENCTGDSARIYLPQRNNICSHWMHFAGLLMHAKCSWGWGNTSKPCHGSLQQPPRSRSFGLKFQLFMPQQCTPKTNS